jgi:putative MFS transporter
VGVFTMIAVMYGILATCIQFGPETYGKSMENVNVAALPEGA